MSLLHIFRNLAVLAILTVAGLSLSPRAVAAQSVCQPIGGSCTSNAQCCSTYCGTHHNCCVPLHGRACTKNADCCSFLCEFGRCL